MKANVLFFDRKPGRGKACKLDGFKWLKEESLEDTDDLPPPDELATDEIAELEEAVSELGAVPVLLENGNRGTSRHRAATANREPPS